jgi:hypothetical protein
MRLRVSWNDALGLTQPLDGGEGFIHCDDRGAEEFQWNPASLLRSEGCQCCESVLHAGVVGTSDAARELGWEMRRRTTIIDLQLLNDLSGIVFSRKSPHM